MVVETNTHVPWSAPDDINLSSGAGAALAGAGSRHPGGFNLLMADGSVRFLKMTISPTVFNALITRNGGEVISSGDY